MRVLVTGLLAGPPSRLVTVTPQLLRAIQPDSPSLGFSRPATIPVRCARHWVPLPPIRAIRASGLDGGASGRLPSLNQWHPPKWRRQIGPTTGWRRIVSAMRAMRGVSTSSRRQAKSMTM